VLIILTLFLGGFIVAATKWGIDLSFPRTKTATTQQFSPVVGNLTFSATAAAENEVLLNLTFQGTGAYGGTYYVWTIWVSNSSSPGPSPGYENLPEGLRLVEGALKANASCPVPNKSLSLQAKLQTVADGEWIVHGWFSATAGPGFFCGLSAGGIKITVSNGNIVQLEKSTYPASLPTEQPSNQTERPTSPPIH